MTYDRSKKIEKIEKLRSELAELENQMAEESRRELATLHFKYGFDNLGSFIEALQRADGSGTQSALLATKSSPARMRQRARITPAIRQSVIELLKTGRTAGEIAAEVGISRPSVQNIKKASNLILR